MWKHVGLSFSVRSLLIAVTLIALLAGWLSREHRLVSQRRELLRQVTVGGGWIIPNADWAELSVSGSRHQTRARRDVLARIRQARTGLAPTVGRVRRMLGDYPVEGFWVPSDLNSELTTIEQLFPESTVIGGKDPTLYHWDTRH